MIEPREPKYQWGQPVRAALDLYNDGTFPERPDDALLVRAEADGEIVQIGRHIESGLPVYLVQFGGTVIGCREEELHLPDAGARVP